VEEACQKGQIQFLTSESLRKMAHADVASTAKTLLPCRAPGSGFFGKSAQMDSSSGNSLAVATSAEMILSDPSAAAVVVTLENGLMIEAGATRGDGVALEGATFFGFLFLRFLSAKIMASAAASNFVDLNTF